MSSGIQIYWGMSKVAVLIGTMDNITVETDLSFLSLLPQGGIDQAHWGTDNMIMIDRLWIIKDGKKKFKCASTKQINPEVDGDITAFFKVVKTYSRNRHLQPNCSKCEASGSGMDEASEGKTREYVTTSSKRVADAVEAAIVDKLGPDASEHPSNDFDLWGEALLRERRKNGLREDGKKGRKGGKKKQ
ncbi:hypothetical protein Tco_0813745 [Tanacetum coccineum]